MIDASTSPSTSRTTTLRTDLRTDRMAPPKRGRRIARTLLAGLVALAALLVGCGPERISIDDARVLNGSYRGTLTEIVDWNGTEGASHPVTLAVAATTTSDTTYEVSGTATIGDTAPVGVTGQGQLGSDTRFASHCFCAPLPGWVDVTIAEWNGAPLEASGGRAYGSDGEYDFFLSGDADETPSPHAISYELRLRRVEGE